MERCIPLHYNCSLLSCCFFVVVLETFYNLKNREGLARAVNLLWNYHEPVSCFLFEMSYYELITL